MEVKQGLFGGLGAGGGGSKGIWASYLNTKGPSSPMNTFWKRLPVGKLIMIRPDVSNGTE